MTHLSSCHIRYHDSLFQEQLAVNALRLQWNRDFSSLQAGSPLSHACNRLGEKQSGGKESVEERAPRKFLSHITALPLDFVLMVRLHVLVL